MTIPTTPAGERMLRRLQSADPDLYAAMQHAIEEEINRFRRTGVTHSKRVKQEPNIRSLRVRGDYRVLFEYTADGCIRVKRFGHRKDVYKVRK